MNWPRLNKIIIIVMGIILICLISYERGYQDSSNKWAEFIQQNRPNLHFKPDSLIDNGDGTLSLRNENGLSKTK